MLAGMEDSDTALAHARELLETARAGDSLTRGPPCRKIARDSG